jgi:uncharacterized protein YjbI with pentapeptide repeats
MIYMETTNEVYKVLEAYRNGQRIFKKLFINGESFSDQVLNDVEFIDCVIYANFQRAQLKNAKFLESVIKTCDFREADLSNAHFEGVAVESTQFARAKTNGLRWIKAYAYGSLSTQDDFEEWIKDHEENS